MYDREFANRNTGKKLTYQVPINIDLNQPHQIIYPSLQSDAIQQQLPIIPELANKIEYIPVNPTNNYIEATR